MSFPLENRPRVLFHGLGSSCKIELGSELYAFDLQQTNWRVEPGYDMEICVETGAGDDSMNKLETQAQAGCEILKTITGVASQNVLHVFRHGFHLIGKSQGGLIARLVYANCEPIRKYIATLTTDGTPNLGSEELPDMNKFGMKGKAVEAFFANIVASVVEAYVKTVESDREYSFLQYLNYHKSPSKLISQLNENPDVTYKDLELYNVLSYEQEHAVMPPTSVSYGLKFKSDAQRWQDFEKSPFYHKLGFGSLYANGRMIFCRLAGEHLQRTSPAEVFDSSFLVRDGCPYFGDPWNFEQKHRAYQLCSQEKLRSRKWLAFKCRFKEQPGPKDLHTAAQMVLLRDQKKRQPQNYNQDHIFESTANLNIEMAGSDQPSEEGPVRIIEHNRPHFLGAGKDRIRQRSQLETKENERKRRYGIFDENPWKVEQPEIIRREEVKLTVLPGKRQGDLVGTAQEKPQFVRNRFGDQAPNGPVYKIGDKPPYPVAEYKPNLSLPKNIRADQKITTGAQNGPFGPRTNLPTPGVGKWMIGLI